MFFLDNITNQSHTIILIAQFQQYFIQLSYQIDSEINQKILSFDTEEASKQYLELQLKTAYQAGFKESLLSKKIELSYPNEHHWKTQQKFEKDCLNTFQVHQLHHLIYCADIEYGLKFIHQLSKKQLKEYQLILKNTYRFWHNSYLLNDEFLIQNQSIYQTKYPHNAELQSQNRSNRHSYYSSPHTRRKIAYPEQLNLFFLMACGILSPANISMAWVELIDGLNAMEKNEQLKQAIILLKPTWFNKLLSRNLKVILQNLKHVDYHLIRFLESLNLLDFDAHLFAHIVPYMRYQADYNVLTEYYAQDVLSIQRDIPLLFEYESNLKSRSFNNHLKNETPVWQTVLVNLVNQNKLDRMQTLIQCIQIQAKAWNMPNKAFFKNLFIALQTTPSELIQIQTDQFEILKSGSSPTVQFVIKNFRTLLDQPEFNLSTYLSILEQISLTETISSAIKLVIPQLKTVITKYEQHRQQSIQILLQLLIQADMNQQHEIAMLIAQCTSQYNSEINILPIQLFIDTHQDSFKGDTSSILRNIFSINPTLDHSADEPEKIEFNYPDKSYQYIPSTFNYLDEQHRLVIQPTWEYVVATTKFVLKSQEIYAVDQFFSLWLTTRHQRPEGFKNQLQSFINRLFCPALEPIFLRLFQSKMWTYFTGKIDHDTEQYLSSRLKEKTILNFWDQHIDAFLDYEKQESKFEMLSLPSHKPSYLEASVLVERCIAYEQAAIHYHPADLCLALSRLPSQDFTKAIQLLSQLKDDTLRNLLNFAFQSNPSIETLHPDQLAQINLEPNLKVLYSTALITREPSAQFNQQHMELPQRFNLNPELHPVPYHLHLHQMYNNKIHIQKNENKTSVHLLVPEVEALNNLDLYALQFKFYGPRKIDEYLLYNPRKADLLFFHHLTPVNHLWLDLNYAANSCFSAQKLAEQTGLLFERMLEPDYQLNCYSIYLLTSSFYQTNKDLRQAAIDVLKNTIAKQSLQLDYLTQHLAELIHCCYGPLKKPLNALEELAQVSNLHQNFVLQILEGIFYQTPITLELPRDFKKFFELYYQLMVKQNVELDTTTQKALQQWQIQHQSLKPIIQKLMTFKLAA